MNDLTRYKVEKFLMGMLKKIILIPFIPIQILYTKNETFKNWLDKKERRRYKKQTYKKEIKQIAYYLNRNEDKSCSVFFGYNPDSNIPTDVTFYPNSVLLENDSWIKRNKLTVEKYTLESYCNTYFADENLINLYHTFASQKERTVLILRKP
jgi:hypothetical protein